MGGWVLWRDDSVVHILFLCPVFLRVFFAESKREREKDTLWQQTVASCSVVGFMLTTPLPHPQHTHIHYLLEFERERPYLLLPTCLTSTLHQFSSRAFCLLSF